MSSGYFLSQKLIKSNYKFASVKHQEVKLVKIYLFWSIIFLVASIPNWVITGWLSWSAFVDYGIATFTRGSYYHFWYLISLIYALPLFYLCIRLIKKKTILLLLSIGMYSFRVLTLAYSLFIPETIANIPSLFERISAVFVALFTILPLLLLGFFIALGFYPKLKIAIIGLVISVILLVIEALVLHNRGVDNVSFLFSTYPTVFFIFSIALKISWKPKNSITRLLGAISLIIYCIHPLIILVLQCFTQETIILFLITSIISTAIGLGVTVIQKSSFFKK